MLKQPAPKSKTKSAKDYTHIFKVKAPLLNKHEAVCLLGNYTSLHNWSTTDPIIYPKMVTGGRSN
ncbi:MAG: hypothetical protein WDO16_07220 [Bacteroidota bacterium]